MFTLISTMSALLLLLISSLTIALPTASPIAASRSHGVLPDLQKRNTTNPSVYVCQNYDWIPPCLFIPLGPSENGQMNFWMAPVPGGPGPFGDSNYTIGSWGPSDGVSTYWVDNDEKKSDVLTWPGTGTVQKYWTDEVWTWYPSWQE